MYLKGGLADFVVLVVEEGKENGSKVIDIAADALATVLTENEKVSINGRKGEKGAKREKNGRKRCKNEPKMNQKSTKKYQKRPYLHQ